MLKYMYLCTFSEEGVLNCIHYETSGSVTYLTLSNIDSATPDETNYYKYTCLVNFECRSLDVLTFCVIFCFIFVNMDLVIVLAHIVVSYTPYLIAWSQPIDDIALISKIRSSRKSVNIIVHCLSLSRWASLNLKLYYPFQYLYRLFRPLEIRSCWHRTLNNATRIRRVLSLVPQTV